MNDTNVNQFEFDDEFRAEMERRDRELDENPSMALTHEEVMESVEEAIQQVAAERLSKSCKTSERGASAP